MDDGTKGDFAEWLVARLLGLSVEPGGYISGGNYDFDAADGITIEVKSSSYWQSWKLYDERQRCRRSREEIAALA